MVQVPKLLGLMPKMIYFQWFLTPDILKLLLALHTSNLSPDISIPGPLWSNSFEREDPRASPFLAWTCESPLLRFEDTGIRLEVLTAGIGFSGIPFGTPNSWKLPDELLVVYCKHPYVNPIPKSSPERTPSPKPQICMVL